MTACDVLVIGGGIAGVGLAAEMSAFASVTVLEREDALGRHATGRSAAYLAPEYGNALIRELTRLSAPFFRDPPEGFAAAPLLRPRDEMMIARADQAASFETALAQAAHPRRMSADEALARIPILRPGHIAQAAVMSGGGDIEVDLLLQSYARRLRAGGGQWIADAGVTGVRRTAAGWAVEAGGQTYEARVLVNAAGAWADAVAAMAGVGPLGLQPLRRTAVLVDGPAGVDIADWPFVFDVEEAFYFKPDAGAIMISPADETPSEAVDAAPEELDVAIAVDLFEQATTMRIRRVRHRWAGLRTFAPDRSPVLGFDPRAPGFFWLAGQGGYGVQTAPAMSRMAAERIAERSRPEDADLLKALNPARLINP